MEASKVRIYEVSGNTHEVQYGLYPVINEVINENTDREEIDHLTKGFAHSMMVDEGFLLVAAHVDEALVNKFAKGQYVKFSKLLP